MTHQLNPLNDQLLGVVLAGGRSTRMGQDKASMKPIELHGKSFLQIAIDRMRAVCSEVRVSGDPARLTSEILVAADLNASDFLLDPLSDAGPIAGVLAGLRAAGQMKLGGCLFIPVDSPNLGLTELNELIRHWQLTPTQITCGVSGDGTERRCQPLIAIYPIACRDAIESLVASGARSLNRWLDHQSVTSVPMTPAACHNVNQPSDLGRIQPRREE